MSYNTMYPSKVLVFSEKVKGWVSFRSHTDMQNGISMGNDYYTFFTGTSGNLWIHYDESISRNTFYNGYAESTVSVVLNTEPGSVKVFNTLNYEGSQSKINQFVSQSVALPFQNTTTYNDQEIYNLSPVRGWYVERMFTDMEEGYINEFIEKENKWFNNVNRLIDITLPRANTDDFTFQGIGIVGDGQQPPPPPPPPIPIFGCTDPNATNYDFTANNPCTPYVNGNPGCCTY